MRLDALRGGRPEPLRLLGGQTPTFLPRPKDRLDVDEGRAGSLTLIGDERDELEELRVREQADIEVGELEATVGTVGHHVRPRSSAATHSSRPAMGILVVNAALAPAGGATPSGS